MDSKKLLGNQQITEIYEEFKKKAEDLEAKAMPIYIPRIEKYHKISIDSKDLVNGGTSASIGKQDDNNPFTNLDVNSNYVYTAEEACHSFALLLYNYEDKCNNIEDVIKYAKNLSYLITAKSSNIIEDLSLQQKNLSSDHIFNYTQVNGLWVPKKQLNVEDNKKDSDNNFYVFPKLTKDGEIDTTTKNGVIGIKLEQINQEQFIERIKLMLSNVVSNQNSTSILTKTKIDIVGKLTDHLLKLISVLNSGLPNTITYSLSCKEINQIEALATKLIPSRISNATKPVRVVNPPKKKFAKAYIEDSKKETEQELKVLFDKAIRQIKKVKKENPYEIKCGNENSKNLEAKKHSF